MDENVFFIFYKYIFFYIGYLFVVILISVIVYYIARKIIILYNYSDFKNIQEAHAQ